MMGSSTILAHLLRTCIYFGVYVMVFLPLIHFTFLLLLVCSRKLLKTFATTTTASHDDDENMMEFWLEFFVSEAHFVSV